VPARFTVGFGVFAPETIPGPDQLYIAPVVLDDPLRFTVVAEQVRVCAGPAFEFGIPALELTATVLVALHPLLRSVTVRV
jgi:hypothetical protein